MELGFLNIVSACAVTAAVFLPGRNQALTQLVRAFANSLCIPHVVHGEPFSFRSKLHLAGLTLC
jgi:hypothetical protein